MPAAKIKIESSRLTKSELIVKTVFLCLKTGTSTLEGVDSALGPS